MGKKLSLKDVTQYVKDNIGDFHKRRVDALKKLKLSKVVSKKNPYLFKAKHVLTAQDIVKGITDAYISSQEEGIFGNWLEGLAIFVNERVYAGRKSGIEGIDLEFDSENIRHIVTIKSGPNWGNSGQLREMEANFIKAKRILHTSNSKLNVIAVNGCCYGKDNVDKGVYYKYCGQKFWEFISGDDNLFIKIIEPLGNQAKERNDEFQDSYSKMINLFTKDFTNEFCKKDGSIDWEKLVRFNSGKK